MGTNYYLKPQITLEEAKVLKKFNLEVPNIHLGKSTWGWVFTFNTLSGKVFTPFTNSVKEGEVIDSYARLMEVIKPLIEQGVLTLLDEYNTLWSIQEFITLVQDKSNDKKQSKDPRFGSYFHVDEQGYEFMEGNWS